MSMGAGLENRTELSVGRVIAPLSFNVNDKLYLGMAMWAHLRLIGIAPFG